jgi:hypothetical protein
MSETLRPVDQTPLFTELMYERLSTRITPEMGFQSYEKLDGDKAERARQKEAFISGASYNPTFDYPLLDKQELELKKAPLEILISQSAHMNDGVAGDAVRSSAHYRLQEMSWLQEAKTLNDLASERVETHHFTQSAEHYQALNERLYGKPSEQTVGQVYGEIFAQAAGKELDERGKEIYNELLYGITFEVAGEEVVIPALAEKANGRLPVIEAKVLEPLIEVLKEDTAFIAEITQNYWDDAIVPRSQQDGSEPGFNTDDMEIVFKQTLAVMDPENKAGITIRQVGNKSVLSWDTPSLTVEIGATRANISSSQDMYAKIVHELYIHGGRAIRGLNSELPVLGTGLYTEADEGERADYLTFEEGFATVAEKAIMGEGMSWKAIDIGHYLNIANSYDGADFRRAFEISWRARALMQVKSGEPMTDEVINKEKAQSYLSLQRVRRGTPTQLSHGPVLTFNKDLAYLDGKLVTVDYLEAVGNDKSAIRRLFVAKGDPTNHRQAALVEQYGEKIA